MATQASVVAVLESEALEAEPGGLNALPLQLDAIPGAVWQAELHALMPKDVRVSLFELGARKCAILRFQPGEREAALAAFERALAGANEVSEQSYQVAAQARARRESERAGPAES